MSGKFEITGTIEVLTGMHIGGSKEFSAIGAVDSPVMRDVKTNDPFIPGSSIKGKLRFLLQEKYGRGITKIHNDDAELVCKLFGSGSTKENTNPQMSRLYFSDAFLTNKDYFKSIGINEVTEVKFENTIDRYTAVAMPRQIERVIRGSEFGLNIIYNGEKDEDIEEDLGYLKEAFELLKYSALGGSGSRGYGRVKIKDLKINLVTGDIDGERVEAIKEKFEA